VTATLDPEGLATAASALHRDAKIHALCREAVGDEDAWELASSVKAALARRIRDSGKTCGACQTFLPLSAFGTDGRERDGLFRVCQKCRSTPGAAS
jgi:hypothetical protein